jgi:hypothetical protein
VSFAVAVVGSRDFGKMNQIQGFLDQMLKLRPDLTIVSGGADGVDRVAEEWARAKGVPCQVFQADWEADPRGAGIKRNALIVEASQSMIAFWDGESTGTQDSICRGMKKKDYPVRVFLG